MTSTLIQMTLIMACGVLWRSFKPAGLTAEQTRTVLTSVVYYVFLPALILDVLWSTRIGIQSLEYTLVGVCGIVSIAAITWLLVYWLKFSRPVAGAIILATAFPNVTYLGLPVLQQTFGDWAKSVVIQLDLFAATPLVFTLGILIAQQFGERGKTKKLLSFFNTPPIWTAILAVTLNVAKVPIPAWLTGVLQHLLSAVVPLMLFSLGLALNWRSIRFSYFPYILPIIVIKLFVMPLLVLELVQYLSMDEQHKAVTVLDMAMPSMMIGIVFCDRYHLDSALYAMAVTITTLCSIVTLPFWYGLV